jgi:hypothetical protein
MRLSCLLLSLAIVAMTQVLSAQDAPTAYTITQSTPMSGVGTVTTIYRNGSKAAIEVSSPAQNGTPAHTARTVFDLAGGKSWSWNPADSPINCSVGRFSGDWGDPFQSATEIADGIAKGELKPAGNETLHGISTNVYTGGTQEMSIKAWFDPKTRLAIKEEIGPAAKMSTMLETTKVSLAAPEAGIFELPAACASLKPLPTETEKFAEVTGDDGANYANPFVGPGSANSCTIVLRVVNPKTMAPSTRRWQAAIDTTYDQNNPNPPHYEYGVGTDGTSTFAGGGLHEITSQIHNDMLRIENPPAYFNLAINVVTPGHGAGTGLVYRKCFAPVTMLYWVLNDPNGADGDMVYAKAGKYAAAPAK